MNTQSKASMLAVLKRRAAAQVAMYPQYKGHFRSYVLCRIKEDVVTKFGLAFTAGEIAICVPRSSSWGNSGSRTVWSMRNSIDTSVPRYDVEDIGVRGGSRSPTALRRRRGGR